MDQLKVRAEKLLHGVETAVKDQGADMAIQARDDIRRKMTEPGFWSNPDAQELSKQQDRLTKKHEPWTVLLDDTKKINDPALYQDSELRVDLESEISALETRYNELKKQLRFQGPYDDHDVILNIYAGAGGTDAQDWAQMLERMYLRWAEGQGLKSKVIDESPGEAAGIKSATIEISGGDFLYGKLAGEHGVHRLVRRSPFNSAASRETSFAKVDVLPVVDRPDEVELDDKDLKIDVFRAGGHGGQSVNTTDSAVRVTHLPTGVMVAIQNERSQLQNKETALAILRSRLAQLQLEQHAETLADIKGPSQSNEFGSQIRNYILDDRIVKDLRTGYETHDPQKVLDGGLEPLIEAWLEKG